MNLIQENTPGVDWYTNLNDVFGWLDISPELYDWHFANIDGGWAGLNEDPIWITGEKLKEKLSGKNDQFIWAVISAFPKGSKPLKSEEPYADGNSRFWKGSPEKQLIDSLFEIVCWDSSATLFIGLPEKLGFTLVNNAPGVRDLDRENLLRKC